MMEGELQKRIGHCLQITNDEIVYIPKPKELFKIVREAKKEFPLQEKWKAQTTEGEKTVLGHYDDKKVSEWFVKWFGSE